MNDPAMVLCPSYEPSTVTVGSSITGAMEANKATHNDRLAPSSLVCSVHALQEDPLRYQ